MVQFIHQIILIVLEKELNEWDNRDNVHFSIRPTFAPIYTREMIDEYKIKLSEYDMSFIPPVSLSCQEEE